MLVPWRVNNVTTWTLKKPELLYEPTKTTDEELTDPARKDGKTATLRLKVTPEFGFLRSMMFFQAFAWAAFFDVK